MTYIIAAFLMAKGTFTITLPRQQMVTMGLVLSDTPDFARPRHEILSPPVIDLWNISAGDIPDDVHLIDGEHNGENYLAMTVYLKNSGDRDLDYQLALDISEIYRNVDDALRIRLYVNDKPELYAKKGLDGQPEPDTLPFTSATRAITRDYKHLAAGAVDKFTIVAWVEGNDPDCTDELLGGFIKMVMSFNARLAEEVAEV